VEVSCDSDCRTDFCDGYVSNNCSATISSFTSLHIRDINDIGLNNGAFFTSSEDLPVKELEMFKSTESTALSRNPSFQNRRNSSTENKANCKTQCPQQSDVMIVLQSQSIEGNGTRNSRKDSNSQHSSCGMRQSGSPQNRNTDLNRKS
jgi:hypothetical protein